MDRFPARSPAPGTLGPALVVLLWGLAAVPAARALDGSAEIYAGLTDAETSSEGPTKFGDETVVGVRGGLRLRPFLAVEAAVGRDERSGRYLTGEATFERDFTSLDLSVLGTVQPGGRVEWFLFGGPGWTWEEGAVRFETPPGRPRFTYAEDRLSLNVGTGLRVTLGSRFYLRPELRWRWQEEHQSRTGFRDQTTDFEVTLGLGVRLGH